MMSKTIRYALFGAVLVLCTAMTVRATNINGNITFAGSLTLDTGSAGTATAVTAWDNTSVISADGDYSPTVGMSAVFTAPWQFAIPPGPPIINFWSVGGFTFDLVTSTVIAQGFDNNGNGYVAVVGTGIASGNGFNPTSGIWRFTTQDPSAQGIFSFSAADGVPEPSTVALLVVGGLLIAAGLRARSRKIRA